MAQVQAFREFRAAAAVAAAQPAAVVPAVVPAEVEAVAVVVWLVLAVRHPAEEPKLSATACSFR